VEEPDWVTKGYGNSLIAWKGIWKKKIFTNWLKSLEGLQNYPQKKVG
jgi:hypothetical protein